MISEISYGARLCHVRGFYLSIGRGALCPVSIFQCLRSLVAEPNWLTNRLYLANVTMPTEIAAGVLFMRV